MIDPRIIETIEWWKKMTLEERFYKTIEHKNIIGNGEIKHPDTLTLREIEILYNKEH